MLNAAGIPFIAWLSIGPIWLIYSQWKYLCLTTYKPCLSLQARIIHSLLGPTGDMEYNYSPAVSFLSCIEESSPLMYLTSISAAMSGRLMIGDLLRAATNSDQVELCEDLSHSLSIAVKRPSEVRRSFSIACRMENVSWTIILSIYPVGKNVIVFHSYFSIIFYNKYSLAIV